MDDWPIAYQFQLGDQGLAALTRWAAKTPEGEGIVIPAAGEQLALSLTRCGAARMYPNGEGGWRLEFTELGNVAARELLAYAHQSRADWEIEVARLSRWGSWGGR